MSANIVQLDTARARRIASEVARYGNLENEISAAWANGAGDLLTELLAEKVRLAEAADPSIKAANLIVAANDLCASAERIREEGDEFAGKAAGRRLKVRGQEHLAWAATELSLADSFQRRSDACTRLAEQYEDGALLLRLQAADIMAALKSLDVLKAALGDMSGGFPPEAA